MPSPAIYREVNENVLHFTHELCLYSVVVYFTFIELCSTLIIHSLFFSMTDR